MNTWILLVVIAQFLYAIVAIIDKYIVSSHSAPRPFVYAFYVTALSAFSGVIFFFEGIQIPLEGVAIPSFQNISSLSLLVATVSLTAGIAFFSALVTLFSALKRAAASDVIPVVGASSAIVTFILSSFFLGAKLTPNFFIGFSVLVIGTILLSRFRTGNKAVLFSIISGILFATHFILLKFLFEQTNFDNAFFWSRLGIAATAFLVLLIPFIQRRFKLHLHNAKKHSKTGIIILSNKILAGIASLILLKAIDLGDVSIVQALGGLQFAFLLIFSAFIGHTLPQICGEHCSKENLFSKAGAVAIIIIGFAILFL